MLFMATMCVIKKVCSLNCRAFQADVLYSVKNKNDLDASTQNAVVAVSFKCMMFIVDVPFSVSTCMSSKDPPSSLSPPQTPPTRRHSASLRNCWLGKYDCCHFLVIYLVPYLGLYILALLLPKTGNEDEKPK